MQVDILEAMENLSNLIKMIETGKEDQIIIARDGIPVVKMAACNNVSVSKRIGVAKGRLQSPKNLDQGCEEKCILSV
ncbi:MAG: hypothetical protein IJ121_01790 [Eubacterium sp.]|nr:hypothetical protein [Eubacterium sp.]